MRRPLKKRNTPKPDYRYGSVAVEKFINYIMQDGKKEAARKALYGAFDELKQDAEREPVEVFEAALKNVGPLMEVRSRRVGGANYQVPREVRQERRSSLAMRWLLAAARNKRGSRPFAKALAEELKAAANNEGDAVKKREDMHRMADANKAFAHFTW